MTDNALSVRVLALSGELSVEEVQRLAGMLERGSSPSAVSRDSARTTSAAARNDDRATGSATLLGDGFTPSVAVDRVVIDCAALARVTPAGLSALHELGRRHAGELALAGLSRALMRTAVQARLAQKFAIYATAEAFTRAHEAPESQR